MRGTDPHGDDTEMWTGKFLYHPQPSREETLGLRRMVENLESRNEVLGRNVDEARAAVSAAQSRAEQAERERDGARAEAGPTMTIWSLNFTSENDFPVDNTWRAVVVALDAGQARRVAAEAGGAAWLDSQRTECQPIVADDYEVPCLIMDQPPWGEVPPKRLTEVEAERDIDEPKFWPDGHRMRPSEKAKGDK